MIQFQNTSVVFNKNTALENTALQNIHLTIAAGDFITLVGGNGAGKSTLLNLLSGEVKASDGKVFLGTKELGSLTLEERAAEVAYVYQDPRVGTCESFTIEENLALALRRGKKRGFSYALATKRRELFRKRLASLNMGLEKRLNDKVALLSGGQRQALSLLMATLQPAKVLLLDEHTAALDPKTAKMILALTQRIIEEQQLTAIMITHQLSQALELGNRILVLREGRVVNDLSGKERADLNPVSLLEYL